MATFSIKINGGITVKAKKAVVQALAHAFSDLQNIHKSHREINGVKPESETPEQFAELVKSASILTNIFGVGCEKQEVPEITEFLNALPAHIEAAEIPQYIQKARQLFLKNLRVVDKRRTQAEVVEADAQYKRNEDERKAKNAAFVAEFCKSTERISIPSGMMAVTLQVCFDDSHSMSDYFHPHASIGTEMLLAIVPKQAKKEAIARKAMAAYPELAKLNWEWNVENYSMGHGNYLESAGVGEMNLLEKRGHKAYDGRETVVYHYEITFDTYNKSILPFRGYGEQQAEEKPAPVIESNGKPQMRLNDEKNGVEILFAAKPEQSTLNSLKCNGFRWSPANRLWYARQNEATLAFARMIAA